MYGWYHRDSRVPATLPSAGKPAEPLPRVALFSTRMTLVVCTSLFVQMQKQGSEG